MGNRPETAAEAFARRAWGEVFRELTLTPRAELDAADLELLAEAAYLTGHDDDAVAAWEDAQRRYLRDDDPAEAARCGFWIAFCFMMRGQMAHASGWLTRTGATIDDELDCPAIGYLMIPTMLGTLEGGDAESAVELAVRMGAIAERFADRDLAAFSTLGHGQALLAMGSEAAGLACLDEVMVSVTSGEVGAITSGIVYCAVILECMQLFDLGRAAEWTTALADWCATQTDLVPYRGQCLVHQSQLQQAAGDWSTALETVAAARERLTDPPHPALGLAYYQQGELHRIAGQHREAAGAYRRASRSGHQPMPGLALLELARGNGTAAAAGIRRALTEAARPFQRPSLLAAAVEIHVAAVDLDAGREAAEELSSIADASSSEVLRAMAQQASGSIELAAGRPAEALAELRAACAAWQRLRLPYEVAKVTVLIGQACVALGDRTAAALSFDEARATFSELGARPDLEGLPTLGGEAAGPGGTLISEREREVLTRVARGMTNREIAAALSISPHTVGRHLENIFTKLDVNSRASATAFAYEHDLL